MIIKLINNFLLTRIRVDHFFEDNSIGWIECIQNREDLTDHYIRFEEDLKQYKIKL